MRNRCVARALQLDSVTISDDDAHDGAHADRDRRAGDAQHREADQWLRVMRRSGKLKRPSPCSDASPFLSSGDKRTRVEADA
jgi:hypothetical protein